MAYRAEAVIKPKGYKAKILSETVDTEAEAIEKVRTFLLPTAFRSAVFILDGEEDGEDFGDDPDSVRDFIASKECVETFFEQLYSDGQLRDKKLLSEGVWPEVGSYRELDLLIVSINDIDGYYVGSYDIRKL